MPWKVGNKNTNALSLFYLLNSNCMERGEDEDEGDKEDEEEEQEKEEEGQALTRWPERRVRDYKPPHFPINPPHAPKFLRATYGHLASKYGHIWTFMSKIWTLGLLVSCSYPRMRPDSC
jgi:hypothetical protein